jgi:hypothetical protein
VPTHPAAESNIKHSPSKTLDIESISDIRICLNWTTLWLAHFYSRHLAAEAVVANTRFEANVYFTYQAGGKA